MTQELRQDAQRLCRHCCQVRYRVDEEHPFGQQDPLIRWCCHHVGPRWIGWYYRGGGIWCFRHPEDLVAFQLTWQGVA